MNIVDMGVLFIMAISMIIGAYNGFVLSACHAASFFLSWVIAVIFYPLWTKLMLGLFPKLFSTLAFYVDGSSMITNVEDRVKDMKSLSPNELSGILNKLDLPNPFRRILTSETFQAASGAKTLGEYFNSSMAAIILNIISILLVFLLAKLIFTIVLDIRKAVRDLPVLKRHDSLAGMGLGLVRGLFIINLLFAFVPILMTMAPAAVIHRFMDGSLLADFFYRTNIFTSFVRGSI